ncbi:hypothetical protein GQ600_25212 [Phytophthora cactorum]|nr:hypothetical protein GQ600_25212 [Phytophthora cactorum]
MYTTSIKALNLDQPTARSCLSLEVAHVLKREIDGHLQHDPDHQQSCHEVVLALRAEVIRFLDVSRHRHVRRGVARRHRDDVLVVAELHAHQRCERVAGRHEVAREQVEQTRQSTHSHVCHLLVRHQSRHPLTHVRTSRRVEVEDEHEEDEVASVVTPTDEPVLDRHEQNDHDDQVRDLSEPQRQTVGQRTVVVRHAFAVEHSTFGARHLQHCHEVDDANKVHAVVDETDVRVDLLDTGSRQLVERRTEDDSEQREEEHAHEVVLRVAPVRELLLFSQVAELVPETRRDRRVVECRVTYELIGHFSQLQRTLPVRLVQLAVLVLHRVVLHVTTNSSTDHFQHVRGRIVLRSDLLRAWDRLEVLEHLHGIHTKVAEVRREPALLKQKEAVEQLEDRDTGLVDRAQHRTARASDRLHSTHHNKSGTSEQDARVRHHLHADRHALLLLHRQAAYHLARDRRQLQQLQRLIHKIHSLLHRERRRQPQISREHERLVDRRSLRVDVHLLTVRRDAAEVGRVLRLAVHDDVADNTATGLASGDHVHQRRLAGTCRTHKSYHAARLEMRRDAAEKLFLLTRRQRHKVLEVLNAQVRRRKRQTATARLRLHNVPGTGRPHFHVHVVFLRSVVRHRLDTNTLVLLIADEVQRQAVQRRKEQVVGHQNANAEPDVLRALRDREAVEELGALCGRVPVARELRQHHRHVRADGVLEAHEHQEEHDVLLERPRQSTHEVEERAQDERHRQVHRDLHHRLRDSVRHRTEEVAWALLRDAEEDHAQVVRRAHVEVDHTEHETHDQGFEQLTPKQRRITQPDELLAVQQQHRAWDERQAELRLLLRACQVSHALGLLEILGFSNWCSLKPLLIAWCVFL